MNASSQAIAAVTAPDYGRLASPQKTSLVSGRDLPASHELHVWFLDLDDPFLVSEPSIGVLTPAERSRGSRLLRTNQRRRWMACRAAVRRILGEYIGLSPQAVPLDRGPSGKPFVRQSANPGELRFNVSHSDSLGVMVVGRDVEVGVDIEITRPLRAFDGLVARCLSPEEQAAIELFPPHDRQRAFLRYWTHKEAFLKAVGSGLSRPLTSVVIDLSRVDARLEDRAGLAVETGFWASELMVPLDGYGAIVSLDSAPRTILSRTLGAPSSPKHRPKAPVSPVPAPAPVSVGRPIAVTSPPRHAQAIPRSIEEITDWVTEFLARDLGVSAASIDIGASFDTFGLDSAVAIEMTGDLERWLGIAVDPMLLYDHPTIDALARHLSARFDQT